MKRKSIDLGNARTCRPLGSPKPKCAPDENGPTAEQSAALLERLPATAANLGPHYPFWVGDGSRYCA